MTKKRKTRTVDKNQYDAFLAKAKDFASMMDVSLEQGKWNSVGLQAVHTVISASDAVIVYPEPYPCPETSLRSTITVSHNL